LTAPGAGWAGEEAGDDFLPVKRSKNPMRGKKAGTRGKAKAEKKKEERGKEETEVREKAERR
jgi:hypothetical protein